MPVSAAATAAAPKMSAGMASGSTIRISSIPPLRSPSVSAAPSPPSRLRMGVPRARLASSMSSTSPGRPNESPTRGEATISGSP
jgi:hypothetical protein